MQSCSSQEFIVKAADRIELMAMLGAFGAIVSACQMYPSSNKSTIFEKRFDGRKVKTR